MNANNDNKNYSITFTAEEALVLLEWLHRFNEGEHPNLFEDQAEKRILYDLEAELEKFVSVTFTVGYRDMLLKAWDNIRDKE